MNSKWRNTKTGREERDDDQVAATAGNGREEGWLTQVVRILQLANLALTAEEAIVRVMSLVNIGNQAPQGEAEKIPKDVTSSIAHIKKLNEGNWHTWEPTFIDCLQRVHNAKEILYGEIAPGSEVSWAGMLGKQEGTSREHGRSAVSMETMDSYGFTCKGGAGPYARRGRQEEDQAQGACRWLPFRGSRDKSQRNHHRSKEEEQCIGDRQVGPEEEEQCRRSRHCSGGTGVPSKEEEQCRRSRHSSGGQEWC
ncbi:uncharacterized protein UDID_18752 [Ustilago sp. UG-2017a]|nr:uncharacterized protein UDID_18752 [Ustilago sp. UG-2017a]